MRSVEQVFNVLIPTGVAYWLGLMATQSHWSAALAAVFMAAIFGIGERISNENADIVRMLARLNESSMRH